MDTAAWKRARDLFDRAVELDGADRRAYLEEACKDDTQVLRQVQTLLAHDAREGVLDPPGRDEFLGTEMPAPERAIGPYRIEHALGSGGMGTVYLAHRADEHFEKRVAIKVIKRGMDSEEILRRFRTERQVLANLEHPGIAGLLDGGATSDGRPYVVMEFVAGRPIDRYCAEEQLSVDQRVVLFRHVCAAVDHAHASRVIHRDLKPSNILVADDGVVKLLDFGIAKVLEPAGGVLTAPRTVTGQQLMTPEYASPEHVLGEPMTEASDVYSLGVVLYELLSGRRPYALESHAPSALERVICHQVPPRPSAAAISATRTQRARLAGDLDTITLKALRKEPSRRYASARALSEDLERHLVGRPVTAQPDTLRYRCSKFVRRNRTLVASAAAIVLALGVALVVSTKLYLQAERARSAGLYREYVANIAAGIGALESADAAAAAAHLAAAPVEHRGWEWGHLAARADLSLVTLEGHEGRVRRSRFSPDGRWLVSGGDDGWLVLWDVAQRREVARWEHDIGRGERASRAVVEMEFLAGGARLVTATEGRGVHVFDLASRKPVATWGYGNPRSMAFDEARGLLVTGGLSGGLKVWNTSDGTLQRTLPSPRAGIVSLTLRRSASELVIVSNAGVLQVQDFETGTIELVHDLRERVRSARASPDRTSLAVGADDGSLVMWDLEADRERFRIQAHESVIERVAWNPDGRLIATASRDRTVRLWSAETGEHRGLLLGHREPVHGVAFHPDGRHLATASRDATVRLWDITDDDVPTMKEGNAHDVAVAQSLDGALLATVGSRYLPDLDRGGLEVALWDLEANACLWRWMGPETAKRTHVSADFDTSGERLAASTGVGFRVWSTSTGETLFVSPGTDEARDVAFLSGPNELLVLRRNRLEVWDLDGSRVVRSFEREGPRMRAFALSPDHLRLLVSDSEKATVLDLSSFETLAELVGVEGGVRDVAWSPDDERVATTSADWTVRLWDTDSWEPEATLEGHTGSVWCVAFSPDASRLASGSHDSTIRLWDPVRAVEACTLRNHTARVGALEFCADGSRLVSKSRSGDVRVWDSSPTR